MTRTPIRWHRSDRMVAAYLSQLAGYVSAGASALLLADQAYPGTIPKGLLIVALVVAILTGGGGIVAGRQSVARRLAAGQDPTRPEAPIHRGPRAASKEVSS